MSINWQDPGDSPFLTHDSKRLTEYLWFRVLTYIAAAAFIGWLISRFT